MNSYRHLWLIVVIVLALGIVAYSQSDHLQMGNAGNLTLKHPVWAGGELLPPGDYEVHHYTSAKGHFIEFARIVKRNWESPDDYEVEAQVPCIIEPLNSRVTKTGLELSGGRLPRLTSLRIRGENVVHVLPTGPVPAENSKQ